MKTGETPLRTACPWREPEPPDDQHDDQDEAQARGHAVGELDDGLVVGASGTTTPLQSGQWLPQPAPEPVARTTAPQRMTSRL